MTKYLIALAGALIMHACAMPALAQTVTSPTLIPGTDPVAPRSLKLISFAGKVSPKVKKNTPVFGPCNASAPFVYSLTAACPIAEPTAPPVTPSPVSPSTTTVMGGEAFIRADRATFGLNSGGGLGTIRPAPAGYPTDVASGYLRVAFYLRERGTEIIARGLNTEGFAVAGSVGGTRRYWRNLELAGRLEVPGTIATDGTWTGEANGLRIRQTVAASGTMLRFAVTLTNTGAMPITGLRYLRTVDFDDLNAFPTDNRIVSRGEVRAGLRTLGKGLAGVLQSDDPRAVATFGGAIVNEDPFASALYDAPAAVGTAKTSDASSNLVFALGDLAPGQSATIAFDLGVE